MFAPRLMTTLVPRQYTPVWTPITYFATTLSPYPVAAVWFWVFIKLHQSAGIHRKKVLWFLLLIPFVLCYPAWLAITIMCGVFFNWCSGPPL